MEDFLQKEVIPAIMETGMMHENSSFVFKSYTVVNHLTDVVDYDDDLRHVIRHYLADEVDFQEGNFFKASKNNLYFVFPPGCVPLEVMHNFDLTKTHLLPVEHMCQREAIEEAERLEVSTPMRAESSDSPDFDRMHHLQRNTTRAENKVQIVFRSFEKIPFLEVNFIR